MTEETYERWGIVVLTHGDQNVAGLIVVPSDVEAVLVRESAITVIVPGNMGEHRTTIPLREVSAIVWTSEEEATATAYAIAGRVWERK
jgi:hypothetical protein